MSLAEATSGALFGSALLSAGVYTPEVIQAQMTFANNTMVAVMMGASAVSAIIFYLTHHLGTHPRSHRNPSEYNLFPYDGNVLGGALIGIGMAITGSCPGTVFVQLGLGMPNGLLVAIGGVMGAFAFVKVRPSLDRRNKRNLKAPSAASGRGLSGKSKKERPLDLPTKLGISPLLVLTVWVSLCLSVLGMLYNSDPSLHRPVSPALVSPVYGGFLVGASQLATLLITGHALGTSAAFEDIGRWLDARIVSESGYQRSKLLTSSVAFGVGMVAASAVLNQTVLHGKGGLHASSGALDASTAMRCVAGGFAMLFGARLGGGCTSGHGISGLAKFSLSSLVSTAGMFSAGILTAQVMRLSRL